MSSPIENLLQFRRISARRPRQLKIRKAKNPTFPIVLEREYQKYLLEYTNTFYKEYLKTKDSLERVYRANPLRGDSLKQDQTGDFFNNYWDLQQDDFRDNLITDDNLRTFLGAWFLKMSVFNKNQTNKVIKSMIGIDTMMFDANLREAMNVFIENNVSLIRTIDQRFYDQVEQATFRSYSQGLRWEELSKEITNRYQVSRSNANRIARDQTNKLNGQLTELRQVNLGIKEYIWHTSLEERVRPNHASKEGRTFKWANPPSDTGHPGNDINCRCWSEPIFNNTKK